MKYPLNTKKFILALEEETATKMEPELKELWKCLVPMLNEAYECGRLGGTYSSCWVKKWNTYFGSEPDPKMKRLLEMIDLVMNRTYEEGCRHTVVDDSVRLMKGGVPA